jgi:hypothetical protein
VEVSVTSAVLVVVVPRKVYVDVLAFQRYKLTATAPAPLCVLPSQSTFRSSSEAADSFTVKTKRVNDLSPLLLAVVCRELSDIATAVYSAVVKAVVGIVFVAGGITEMFAVPWNAVFPGWVPVKS